MRGSGPAGRPARGLPDAAAASRTPPSFGTRLAAAMDSRGPLCVGIDPHPGLLQQWGLPTEVTGLREFSLRALEAIAPHVAAVKPQSACYERFGSAGVSVLAEVIGAARQAGVLCVIDAKRGDIGSTMDAYADAYLSEASDLAGDAVTLAPYLGYESLRPALDQAAASGRGVFVLALTSNPEGRHIQHARTRRPDPEEGSDDPSVAATITRCAAADNAAHLTAGESLGPVGLVVGATVDRPPDLTVAHLAAAGGPILAPGLGAQGAEPQDLADRFGQAAPLVLASASRSVLDAGP